jgi:hypothetical protein
VCLLAFGYYHRALGLTKEIEEHMSAPGNDTITFMAASPLNRLSWLRNSTKFMDATSLSPSTRWLLYRSGDPLVYKQSERPVELSTKRIEKLLGPIPSFGHAKQEGESAPEDALKDWLVPELGVLLKFSWVFGKEGEATMLLPPSPLMR